MRRLFLNMVKNQILADLKKVLESLNLNGADLALEHPAQVNHGDYSTNAALMLWGKRNKSEWTSENLKNPMDLAEKIAECYKKKIPSYLNNIEVAPPGFINFWLSKEYLLEQLKMVHDLREKFGGNSIFAGKKIMVEYAHPNPLKAFHVGHLRTLFTGESIVRMLEAAGCNVTRANYQGDVGMHIAKAIYALLNISPFKDEIEEIKGIKKRVDFLGKAYTAGNSAFEENEDAKSIIKDLNYLVYASAQKFQADKGVDPSSTDYLQFVHGRSEEVGKVFELWRQTRQWSLDYFETIYKRAYSHFDRYYFESECLRGVDLAKEAVKRGVLEDSEGAIIFNGKKYELDNRVFVNSLGLPTYEAKELALAEKELSEFGQLDKVVHVVGPEQVSFFKVTFKVEELLNSDKYKGKQYHLIYGWVRLKKGKMSSRTGNVILGEWLLDEVKKRLKERYQMGERIAEKVAIGAVKYSFLRTGLLQEIAFDVEESISLEGNSGPYLQYTFARTQSVLEKAKNSKSEFRSLKRVVNFAPEELSLLRILYRFPEVVEETVSGYSPNLVCTYLFDLAQRFNLFYQKHPILKAEGGRQEFRLLLTQAVGQVIKNGLYLLGIAAPEKM